jgi:hypothetical protein
VTDEVIGIDADWRQPEEDDESDERGGGVGHPEPIGGPGGSGDVIEQHAHRERAEDREQVLGQADSARVCHQQRDALIYRR